VGYSRLSAGSPGTLKWTLLNSPQSWQKLTTYGFGKFKVKASPEREGRNPADGEKIKIAASKKLSFSPAKTVKDVNA
jgi:nucleoid DNA-binding protein